MIFISRTNKLKKKYDDFLENSWIFVVRIFLIIVDFVVVVVRELVFLASLSCCCSPWLCFQLKHCHVKLLVPFPSQLLCNGSNHISVSLVNLCVWMSTILTTTTVINKNDKSAVRVKTKPKYKQQLFLDVWKKKTKKPKGKGRGKPIRNCFCHLFSLSHQCF